MEEKINNLENEFLCIPFIDGGDIVFIMDHHDNFISLMMIRIFLSLGEIFYFLIVNQLIRDN